MKKIGLWKKLASWFLVLLLVLQIPVDVFAEEWISGTDISVAADSVENEEADYNEEEENTDFYSDENIEESKDDSFTDSEGLPEADIVSFSDGTSLSEEVEEPQEIQVTVSVSKDGKFLNDKDGKPMAGRTVTLNGKASYTMDDALRIAHDLYYSGGAEVGYDYHADDKGIFDGAIYKLWGVNRADVSYIKYSLNHDSSNYSTALGEIVHDGDEMHFFIQQYKEQLAFFTQTDLTITENQRLTLQLKQVIGNYGDTYGNCAGASIYVDGVKQEGLVTDEDGKVTLSGLSPKDTPYFITAEKTENINGTEYAAISAAYVNVTVVKASGEEGSYLKNVTLRTVTSDKQKESKLDILDGSEPFVVSAGMVYLHMSLKAEMYLSAELDEAAPDDCQVYAVYENPKDGVMYTNKINTGSYSYLKYAIAKGMTSGNMINYNQCIRSIRLEVRRNGNVLESHELPIIYRNHLEKLNITDSWGHQIESGLQDTMEDQNLIVTVPENTEYVSIEAQPYSYRDTPKEITLNGEKTTLNYFSSYKLVPDWANQDEYVLEINIGESGKVYCPEAASYTLTIKKGPMDYTPDVKLKVTGKYGTVFQNTEPPVLTADVEVLQPGEGKLSYQWYSVTVPVGELGPEFVKEDQYVKIDGATDPSYVVSTEKPEDEKYYFCRVEYEIDGRIFSARSEFKKFTIVPETVEVPKIETQPQNISLLMGKPVTESFSVALEKAPWRNLTAKYQWYKNTENTTEGGTPIAGADKETYKPSITETGTDYYYCEVWYSRRDVSYTVDEDGVAEPEYSFPVSEKIYTDVVSATILEEPLPWEGNGSEETPYLLNSLTDLEYLRDKVNKDGYGFENTYFQMTLDITLPENWSPIGTIETGHTSGNGKYIRAFSGIFDGNGNTLTVAAGGHPLFNYTRNAVIENLNLYGEKINGYGLVDRYSVDYGPDGEYNTGCPSGPTIRNVTIKAGTKTLRAGLIGGYASGANTVTIENCVAEKGVVIGYSGQESSIGTFAGSINGYIRNCKSAADVYGTDKVGGIAGAKGQSMGSCTIENSSFTGTVNATGKWVGGILGSGYKADSAPNTPVASVKNCYVAGNISGVSNVGGIFGGEPSCMQCWGNGSGSISNNFFYGTVSGKSNVGSIVGYLKSFDKFQGISNNYYLDSCGAALGIGEVENILTAENDPKYGIDYEFNQSDYCFAKTAGEFADGTVKDGLNSGNYHNWEQGESYPVYGAGAYPTGLTLAGDYKTEYYIGEELDLSGGTFTVTWSDGSKTNPSFEEITVIGYDPQTRGSQMLQLKYGAVETTITVKVLVKAEKITVSFMLLGDKAHDSDTDGEVHTLKAGNLETWVPETNVDTDSNATVLDVLEKVLADNQLEYSNPKGNYIDFITKDGEKLGEFTNGKNSGWMYTLNGIHSDLGVSEQFLTDGDEIVFHYTDDYKQEHDHKWVEGWTSDAEGHWHECKSDYGTCDITDNTKKGGYQKHTYGDGKIITAATCKAEGKKEFTCLVCGYTKTETIPKTSQHTYDAGTITKQATYTAAGEKVYTCTVCGATRTEVIPMLTHDHNFTWTVISKATVFSPEKQEGICSICGAKQSRDNGSKLTATMKLNVTSIKLQKKQTTTKVKVTGLANGDSVKSWTSSNKKIVTVDKNGKIKAGKKTGNAKITITLKSGKKATLKVKVQSAKVKTTKITGLKTKLTLKKGKSLTLKPVVAPITSQEKVTYTTSNKKVATVTKNGVIKAKKKGKTTITVKSGKVTKKIKVTIK